MTTTLTDRREVLKDAGCPWAEFNGQQLYLAINDRMANFGFAFGHGEFNREKIEAAYLGPEQSQLAAAIAQSGRINPSFQVRVTPGLEAMVKEAMGSQPGTSWGGYGWDLSHMATGACSWEFASGERLFGCLIGSKERWLVSGLLDPGMWFEGEGWVTFGLAEEVLAAPEAIEGLNYDAICEKAFGKDED